MTMPLAARALSISLLALVIGCSAVATGTQPPATPSPTPTIEPVDPVPPTPEPTDTTPPPTPTPTPSPTPAQTPLPDPTPVPWVEIETEMLALELRGEGLPIENDEMGDGVSADGSEPRDISPDFDLLRGFGGWAAIDQSHFGPDSFFDCADPMVYCGNNPVPIGGNNLVLIGLQGDDTFDVITQRDGQLAVCFDRLGTNNSPVGSGAFGGCDLVLIADLGRGVMFELVFNNGQYRSRDTIGRARIAGDTALFVIPLGIDEAPRYRIVTFERIPPQVAGGEHVDTVPSHPWNVDSFFDVTYSIPGLGG